MRQGWRGWARLVGAGAVVAGMTSSCGSPHGSSQPGFEWGEAGTPSADAGRPGVSDARDDGRMRLPTKPDAGKDTGSEAPDCPPSAKLIYVTGVKGTTNTGNDLYSFDPGAGKFTRIGSMSCLTSPTHMTVDRHGTAWVVSGGELFKASTEDAHCAKAPTWTPDPTLFPDFALSFVGTTAATGDTLYLLGDSGELGAFDQTTGIVAHLGMVPLHPEGDMTTNGDGSLYFLIQEAQQTLNQLSPANGAVHKTWQTGEDSQNTQALAYYGGRFYDFIGSSVYTFDPGAGETKAIGTAPIFVTGAGQSTCVPTDEIPPSELR